MNVEEFEDAIWEIDGVRVAVRAEREREIEESYNYKRALEGEKTVKDLRRLRIEPCLGGIQYEILDGDFEPTNGRMKLKTLRDSYEE